MNVLPVITVSIASNWNIKVHLVILVIRLGLPQIPLDS